METNRNRIYADAYIRDRNHVSIKEIHHMLDRAGKMENAVIHFGPGVYRLEEYESHKTLSIAHDDGCGDIGEKDCHILIQNIKNLTLEGECNPDRSPATILAGYNSRVNQTLLPSILWAENCPGLTVRSLAFTREPECASAGEIVRIDGSKIYVKVFEGNPCRDHMAAYCMNRFSIKEKALLGESLTFGFGFDKTFSLVGERLLMLEDESLAGKVQEGEGLSWHQAGKTDFQIFFGGCDGLTLSALRIYNTNSFAVLTENCRGILAEEVVIRPKENQFFTGPRDGWKIYRCTGTIEVRGCVTEGVRMDGQNVHSNFMITEEILSEHELTALCKYAPIPLRNGYGMEFYRGTQMDVCRIKEWEVLGDYFEMTRQEQNDSAAAAVTGIVHRMTRYRICLEEKIPRYTKKGTLLAARCWEPERYVCTDSSYRNIAGAGHLMRCGEAEIARCTYENMMNAGILIGAEFDTHCEGGHGVRLDIHHNTFENCGIKPRYGKYGMGCIAVKSQGFCAPINKDIQIHDNCFRNSRRALEIRDADGVLIFHNEYKGIEEKSFIEDNSTRNIQFLDSSKGE